MSCAILNIISIRFYAAIIIIITISRTINIFAFLLGLSNFFAFSWQNEFSPYLHYFNVINVL